MIIILEGPNKSGKSTIVRHLQTEYPEHNWKVIKSSAPKPGTNVFKEYIGVIEVMKNFPGNYILDRFHWGSLVYGPIYRGKKDFSLASFLNIEIKLRKLGAVVINTENTFEYLKDLYERENEEFATVDNLQEEIDRYVKVRNHSILPIIRHKVGEKDIIKNGELKSLIEGYNENILNIQ